MSTTVVDPAFGPDNRAPEPAFSGARIPIIGEPESNMSLELPRPFGEVRNELPTPLSLGPQYSPKGFEPEGGRVGGGVLVECESPGDGLPRMADNIEYSRLAASEPKGNEGS